MKQETKDAIQVFLSDGHRHTIEDTDKFIQGVDDTRSYNCKMLDKADVVRIVANLDEDEPKYFVEWVEKKCQHRKIF